MPWAFSSAGRGRGNPLLQAHLLSCAKLSCSRLLANQPLERPGSWALCCERGSVEPLTLEACAKALLRAESFVAALLTECGVNTGPGRGGRGGGSVGSLALPPSAGVLLMGAAKPNGTGHPQKGQQLEGFCPGRMRGHPMCQPGGKDPVGQALSRLEGCLSFGSTQYSETLCACS